MGFVSQVLLIAVRRSPVWRWLTTSRGSRWRPPRTSSTMWRGSSYWPIRLWRMSGSTWTSSPAPWTASLTSLRWIFWKEKGNRYLGTFWSSTLSLMLIIALRSLLYPCNSNYLSTSALSNVTRSTPDWRIGGWSKNALPVRSGELTLPIRKFHQAVQSTLVMMNISRTLWVNTRLIWSPTLWVSTSPPTSGASLSRTSPLSSLTSVRCSTI